MPVQKLSTEDLVWQDFAELGGKKVDLLATNIDKRKVGVFELDLVF